jgi:GT2 family glycosyltransferase
MRAIARDFPATDVRIVVNNRSIGTNRKVSNLANMAAEAKYSNLLVSDSDIRADPSHLHMLARPLEDPEVGVVTCLYRSKASGTAGWIDALGLSTEFQPSVLVARGLEGMSFAMGSGILVRRGVLASIGGFAAFADYLADDFQLGNRPSQLGYRVELSPYVVEHRLGTADFQELLWHQMRWVSRHFARRDPGAMRSRLYAVALRRRSRWFCSPRFRSPGRLRRRRWGAADHGLVCCRAMPPGRGREAVSVAGSDTDLLSFAPSSSRPFRGTIVWRGEAASSEAAVSFRSV